MKKLTALFLVAIMLMGMVSVASAEFKFERKVDIVCPWGIGGGADSTLRPMAEILKEIIGQQVDVVNVEGGGGVNGVEFTYKQPGDGYTFMLGTQSLIMQDLQGALSMDYRDEFVPVAKLVHSVSIIAGSKKALDAKGVTNFAELVEYAKANPWTVTAGMLTATGADGATLKQALAGLDVLELSYSSGSEMNAGLMGGHIDIMITGTDEIQGLIESGDVIPLVACAEQRMSIYPDMQCTGELGIDSYIGTWRGVYAKKGTPQEAIDAMTAAIEEATKNQRWQDFLVQGAYNERVGFENGADLKVLMDKEYAMFAEYLKEEGVLTKSYPDLVQP